MSTAWFMLGGIALLLTVAFVWAAREDRRSWARMRAQVAANRRAGSPQASPARVEVERGDRAPDAPSCPSTPVSAASARTAAADTGLQPGRRLVRG